MKIRKSEMYAMPPGNGKTGVSVPVNPRVSHCQVPSSDIPQPSILGPTLATDTQTHKQGSIRKGDEDLVQQGHPDPPGVEIITYMNAPLRFKHHKTGRIARRKACVLADTCSTTNFVRKGFLKVLPFEYITACSVGVRHLGGVSEFQTEQVRIRPYIGGVRLNLVCTVLDDITDYPIKCPEVSSCLPSVERGLFNHLCEVEPKRPELLLGSAAAAHMLRSRTQVAGHEDLWIWETPVGKIFSGKLLMDCSCENHDNIDLPKQTYFTKSEILTEAFKQMTELETFANDAVDNLTTAEVNSLKIAEQTTEFVHSAETGENNNGQGGYRTGLLWNTETGEPPLLWNNYYQCKRRWGQVEKSILNMSQEKRELVIASIEDHIKLGRYVKVTDSEKIAKYENPHSTGCFFLPPRLVFSKSSSTPARYCLDASARSGNRGPPLNDFLHKGVCTLPDQRMAILRWRRHKYAYVCDLAKFFLSILMKESDIPFQLMVYRRPGSNEPLAIYECRRVIFGIRSSPASADYVLRTHLAKVRDDPTQDAMTRAVAGKCHEALYADNWLAGADSESDLIIEIKALIEILLRANFKMAKFATNSAKVLESIPQELRCKDNLISFHLKDKHGKDLEGTSETTILGMTHNFSTDRFEFGGFKDLSEKFDTSEGSRPLTKRELASVMASVAFDLVGVRSPVATHAKALLQKTFSVYKLNPKTQVEERIGWDDVLPKDLDSKAKTWLQHLPDLDGLQIPRWMNFSKENSTFEIFCDGGSDSICAQAICRTVQGKDISCEFAYASCRVRPVNSELSIPRMEINALCHAVKIGKMLQQTFDIPSHRIRIWSDSLVTHAWCAKALDELAPFHANRVRQYRDSGFQLEYIRSALNSADLGTKICTPAQLKQRQWLHGPSFLSDPESKWPQMRPEQYDPKNPDVLAGLRKGRATECFTTLLTNTKLPSAKFWYQIIREQMKKTNCWVKLQKYIAHILLFLHHLPRKKPVNPLGFSVKECHELLRETDEREKLTKPKNSKAELGQSTLLSTRKQVREGLAAAPPEVTTAEGREQLRLAEEFEKQNKRQRRKQNKKVQKQSEAERKVAEAAPDLPVEPPDGSDPKDEKKVLEATEDQEAIRKRLLTAKNLTYIPIDHWASLVNDWALALERKNDEQKLEIAKKRNLAMQTEKEKLQNQPFNMSHALKEAKHVLFAYSQLAHFSSEMRDLLRGRQVRSTSDLKSLNPKIRWLSYANLPVLVGSTRLNHAFTSLDHRFPILLSSKSPLTRLYFDHIHDQFYHSSASFLLGYARSSVHVLRARTFVKKVVRECKKCNETKAASKPNIMGTLPPERTQIEATDYVSEGQYVNAHLSVMEALMLDFCGPFQVANKPFAEYARKTRATPATRDVYILLGVCLVSKFTLGLVVPDLRASSFLNAFSSLCSLYCPPKKVYLDNATTFQRSKREITTAFRKIHPDVNKKLLESSGYGNVEFNFGSPLHPEDQGLVEAAVRSVKTALRKALHATSLISAFELQSHLYRICAVLNARPLGTIANLSNKNLTEDFFPARIISPQTLVFGRSAACQDYKFSDVCLPDVRDAWLKREQFAKIAKEKFMQSYLPTLHERTKNRKNREDPITIGSMWLVPLVDRPQSKKRQMTPQTTLGRGLGPKTWPVGSVTEILPSKDGIIRRVRLKLNNAVIKTYKDKDKGWQMKILKKPSIVVRDVESLLHLEAFSSLMGKEHFRKLARKHLINRGVRISNLPVEQQIIHAFTSQMQEFQKRFESEHCKK